MRACGRLGGAGCMGCPLREGGISRNLTGSLHRDGHWRLTSTARSPAPGSPWAFCGASYSDLVRNRAPASSWLHTGRWELRGARAQTLLTGSLWSLPACRTQSPVHPGQPWGRAAHAGSALRWLRWAARSGWAQSDEPSYCHQHGWSLKQKSKQSPHKLK